MDVKEYNLCELSLEEKQETDGGFPLLLIPFVVGVLWGIGDAIF
ncbi:hypothetical protein [Saccharicrinis fermentans]|nr:hypothetical protein [Saccharicrinis fermentans]